MASCCTLLVLAPLALMPGLGTFLFRPMALAVTFAMVAAYLLSRSFVPALCSLWLRGHAPKADVLHGATSTLSNAATNVVVMELNDPAASDLLNRSGFVCCSYDPFKRSIGPPAAAISGNGIFIKDKDIGQARQRVEGARPFSVHGWII